MLCVAVTLITGVPDYIKIKGLSFDTMTKEMKEEFQNSFNRIDLILSLILIAIVISILLYFTG